MPKLELMPEGFDPFGGTAPSTNVENRVGESPGQMAREREAGGAADYASHRQFMDQLMGAPIPTVPGLSQQAGFDDITNAPAPVGALSKYQDRVPQRQQLFDAPTPELLAMADEPPPPTSGEGKRLADPIRPQPLVPNAKILEEMNNRFKELAKQGTSHRGIAAEMGMSKTTVTRKMQNMLDTGELNRDEITPRRNQWFDHKFEKFDELSNLIKQGLTHKQIRENLKIGTTGLYKALKELSERNEYTSKGRGVKSAPGVPSMPQFKFNDKAPEEIDQEYINELNKYLKEIQAYYIMRQQSVA